MTCNTCNECDPCDKEKKSCCELKVLGGDCVDVEEVDWQYVVSATCPPRVRPWENVTVKIDESGVDGYSKDYTVSAKNDKVSVCSDDDEPGPLNVKIRAESPIEVKTVGCWESNWHLLISLDEDALETPDEKVAVRSWCRPKYLEDAIEIDSELIEANVVSSDWCVLRITDKATTWYDNNVCIWFGSSRDDSEWVDSWWNANEAHEIDFWTRYTWNHRMATSDWIKILEDWYYRVCWQLTVQNNTWPNRFINLARALLIIHRDWEDKPILLSTAKHWQYAKQVVLRWWTWINVDNNGTISIHWTEDDWIRWEPWESQEFQSVQWPWMTFNMDGYFDLHEWDIISLWYRPQSNMWEARWGTFYWKYPWNDDITTEYKCIYWWTLLAAQMVVPKWFTNWEPYWDI